MSAAVYAGSFDPPTNGHAWMIEQASKLFDRLVIAVARNPEKSYSYPLSTRLDWLRSMAEGLENVEIADIQNEFLAHYARRQGINYIVRGVRNTADYQYERAMRYVNSDLHPGVTSVFLMPPRELCEVSSSMVKGMIGPEGWEKVVEKLVPSSVFEQLSNGGGSDGTH